ncbi:MULTISPECIES: hypothetical protein [Kribbella]|uniref:DUF222 domain-containing protein n=1 Tax=Kribbella karoonensis TaxID=324851 RepID=A0ABN2EE78_9ACTN
MRAAVLAGKAVAWRAHKIADACMSLSLEAAAIVDRRVAGIVNSVTSGKLAAITKAAVREADPARTQADAEAAARTRGVFVAQSDVDGTKRFWVRAAAGAVIRFDATIDDLARALAALGDTDTLDQRRAKAIDWIADPAAAHQLLDVARHLARTQPVQPTSASAATSASSATDSAAASDTADPACSGTTSSGDNDCGEDDHGEVGFSDSPGEVGGPARGDTDAFTRRMLAGTLRVRLAAIKQDAYRNGLGKDSSRRNRHTLYVHLTDKILATGIGVLRVEELGPQFASQLGELLGHDQVVVKPVIDLHDQISVRS